MTLLKDTPRPGHRGPGIEGRAVRIVAMSKTVCIVCFDHFTDIDTFQPAFMAGA